MSTAGSVAVDFRRMSSQMRDNIRGILYEESKLILSDLRKRSPVDTGFFVSNWRVKTTRFSSGNLLAGIEITNATPYAFFMEYGAQPEQAPWYYPHRDRRGRFRKGTGKLKKSKGRIWAGGLNPGHSQTVGGAIGPALLESERRLNKIEENVADAIIRELKW